MNIIFVRTRYHYDSYIDFWKLVELAGFETCYTDEVDVRRHVVHILTPINGEWRPHIDNQVGRPRNAHIVLWNLERPSDPGGIGAFAMSNRKLMYGRYFDDVWVSDRALASETMLRFTVLGSDYGLGAPGGEKRYDLVHMSSVVDRRANIYNQFDSKVIAPNCWPRTGRDKVLRESRFALNIHKDNFPFQEPLRLALFAAYGLPVLTEEMKSAYPWSEEYCVFNPYDGICGRLRQMLKNDYKRWRDMGLRARDRMCKDFNFKKMVLVGVRASLCM